MRGGGHMGGHGGGGMAMDMSLCDQAVEPRQHRFAVEPPTTDSRRDEQG
jgi:hypothetical protein